MTPWKLFHQGAPRPKKEVQEGVYTREEVEGEDTVLEPQKSLPIHARCQVTAAAVEPLLWAALQVLVVGGGPSGLSAALAARRTGADVILMER